MSMSRVSLQLRCNRLYLPTQCIHCSGYVYPTYSITFPYRSLAWVKFGKISGPFIAINALRGVSTGEYWTIWKVHQERHLQSTTETNSIGGWIGLFNLRQNWICYHKKPCKGYETVILDVQSSDVNNLMENDGQAKRMHLCRYT